MTGTIPAELGRLTGLEILALEEMSLRGTIPSEIGRMVGLVELNPECTLTGTIPSRQAEVISHWWTLPLSRPFFHALRRSEFQHGCLFPHMVCLW